MISLVVPLLAAVSRPVLAGGPAASDAGGTETSVSAGEAVPPGVLTLEAALRLSARHSSVLRARRQEVEAARARLVTARAFPFDPQVEVTVADRSSVTASSTDRSLGISQEIEIAGQRRLRGAAARRDLAAAEARFLREERLLAARVELAFTEALRAREMLAVEELDAGLAEEFLRLTETRLAAGAATLLDVNLARAVAGRALRARELTRAAYVIARAHLAEEIGLGLDPLPEPVGDLAASGRAPAPLTALLAAAAERRADLAAFREARAAARERIELARKETRPDLRLGISFEREEGTDDILGAGLSLSLPIFHRRRGAVLEAVAASRRVDHELGSLQQTVAREVVAAHAELTAAAATAEQLRTAVVGSLEENLDLLRRSFQAGKIGSIELLLSRREFVESRREYVEALARIEEARITLDLAAGRLPAVSEGEGRAADPTGGQP